MAALNSQLSATLTLTQDFESLSKTKLACLLHDISELYGVPFSNLHLEPQTDSIKVHVALLDSTPDGLNGMAYSPAPH